jgi:hypothetical protein
MAVDNARFEHRVVESRSAHDLLGRELRLVIAGAAARASAQEADQHDLLDTGAPGSVHDVLRALHVDARVGLGADLTVDAGAVRHSVAAVEGGGQSIRVTGTDRVKGHVRQVTNRLVATIGAARD